jgi:hypothetical protein
MVPLRLFDVWNTQYEDITVFYIRICVRFFAEIVSNACINIIV